MTTPETPNAPVPRRRWLLGGLAVAVALVAAGLAALLVNISERKREGATPVVRGGELSDEVEDPAVWGKNFPAEFDLYKKTTDMVRTRYGGSEAMPRTPTQADPRSVVSQSKIEQDTRLNSRWWCATRPRTRPRPRAWCAGK